MSDAEADNRISRWDALLGIGAEREAVAKAVAEELAAVVEWLTRTHGWTCDDCGFNIADLADAIERGEHRREEER